MPATEAWLREAVGRTLLELSLFARTFAAFLLHPGRSARAWQEGKTIFMNPLGFSASAAGMYWAAASVLAALLPISGTDVPDTLAEQLTSAVGPYAHYGLLGVSMHYGLRWLGSKRRVLGSIGVAFFAAGSLGTATALLLITIVRWLGHVRGTSAFELRAGDWVPFGLFVAAVVSYGALCLVMARAMMGLHHAPAWKAVLAAMFAMVVTAVLFGSVLPEGSYGWHPYLRIDLHGGAAVSFGFRN